MDHINNLVSTLSIQFGNILPGVIGAILILLIGIVLAHIVKKLVKSLLTRTTIDEKISQKLGSRIRVDDFISKLFYYIVLIYTLLIVLNLLGADSVLHPIEDMLNGFFGLLPNIIKAGVITYAGYMIATFVSEATGFISNKVEDISQENGIDTTKVNVGNIIKQIVFLFIFIPLLIVALDTLNMDAISDPATTMLGSFMSAIPNLIAAFLLISVFYIAGKYLVKIIVELLKNMGIDKLADEIGITKTMKNTSLSTTIGNVALFFIIFTGIIAAVDKLNLPDISIILNDIFIISGKIFFGFVILFGGLFVSNLALNTVDNEGSTWLKHVIRYAIMGLFLALALHTMGIAENIVELAFALTLGSIAVAFALAFGLGGREAAGKQMERFFKKINKD